MKRGARFLVLDPKVPANLQADYIVLDVPFDQLRGIIRQFEAHASFAESPQGRVALEAGERSGRRKPTCAIQMFVEASHPKVGPTLLKDSIPRAGRS